jgi:hypothetical protein
MVDAIVSPRAEPAATAVPERRQGRDTGASGAWASEETIERERLESGREREREGRGRVGGDACCFHS